MGEGYRIVAASRGLRSEEKQAITRLSPSHEGLCWKPAGPEDDPDRYAVAFYRLPTKRLCVAYSCYAGAEHTARGGHRVYTQNVIFSADDFAAYGFSAFQIVRAMALAGLTTPQLKPAVVLPEVYLPLDANAPGKPASFPLTFSPPHRCQALQRMLEEHEIIVPVNDGWLASAEALLLGVPGPMRSQVSFAAGLRFSLSRRHRLYLFRDEKEASRSRITGQTVEYLDPEAAPSDPSSAWVAFVERHWARADGEGLDRRTSRPFSDASETARERIGTLYNMMDAVPKATNPALMSIAADHLRAGPEGVEDEIRKELVAVTQQTLLRRLACVRWREAQPLWPQLLEIWREKDTDFAQPLIEAALRSVVREDPLDAAEASLDLAANPPRLMDRTRHEQLIDEVLSSAASRLPSDANQNRLSRLYGRWKSLRPGHPALGQLAERCSTAQTAGTTSR